MADSFEVLLGRWKVQRDAATTLALCDALRITSRPEVLDAVGEHVRLHLSSNVAALLATARLFLEYDRLAEAQTALVAAGKAAPRDAAVYRWLGEVLLRRGDAERAEKVFERALGFGAKDAKTQEWLDRCRALRGTQAAKGTRAVAAEIAKRYPLVRAAAPGPLTGEEEDDGETHSYKKAGLQRPAPVLSRGPLPGLPPFTRPEHQPPAIPAPTPPPPRGVSSPPPALRAPATKPLMQLQGAAVDDQGDAVTHFARSRPLSSAPPPVSVPPPLPPAASAPPPPRTSSRPAPPLRQQQSTDLPRVDVVLDALAASGVFETDAVARTEVAWDKPRESPKVGKRLAVLLGSMAVFAGISTGVFFFVKHERDKQHAEAEQLLVRVDHNLLESKVTTFEETEKALSRAFDLDSRSQRAALLWLRERAARGMLAQGGGELAFEQSIERAKEVGVPAGKYAFAQVASVLFQGDLAGAAAQIAKLDAIAKDDAHFQLIAGAVFERAGDPHAAERYDAAVKLAPEWVLAELLATRAAILTNAPGAVAAAQAFRAKYPHEPTGSALVALAWALSPERAVPSPPEVAETVKLTGDLPFPALAIPSAMRAMGAVEAGDAAVTEAEIGKALSALDTPAMAAWLGTLAASAGNEALARRAALVALGYSAAYVPARALVARVALLGGRIDEGLKATEDLDPTSTDVAIVRGAAGYERCDLGLLASSIEAVPEALQKSSLLAGLMRGRAVLVGQPIGTSDERVKLAASRSWWAELVAMDASLDYGDVAGAEKIAGAWKRETIAPNRATRLSRLARYQDNQAEADAQSQRALVGGATLRALYERVLVLADAKKFDEASQLLAKNPAPLGPYAMWLSAYVVAKSGKIDDARARTELLEPPGEAAPFAIRLLALMSAAAMHDTKRGTAIIKPMLKARIINPDVREAASELHMPKL